MSKLSEQVAKSACTALVAFLDLLASNGCHKIGLRIMLDSEQVSYDQQRFQTAVLVWTSILSDKQQYLNETTKNDEKNTAHAHFEGKN